ncbi:hypothetical protein VPH35_085946 [Triticum aestivum]
MDACAGPEGVECKQHAFSVSTGHIKLIFVRRDSGVIWRRTKHFSPRRRNSQLHKQLMFFQVATVMESIHCDDFWVEPGWLPGVAESSSATESLDLLASSGAP